MKVYKLDSRVDDVVSDFVIVRINVDVSEISVHREIGAFETHLTSVDLAADEDCRMIVLTSAAISPWM